VEIGAEDLAELGPEPHHPMRARGFEATPRVRSERDRLPIHVYVIQLHAGDFGFPAAREHVRADQRVSEQRLIDR
jgi:hypothetical protein